MILLFFDPDKPGTTGETLSILTDSLQGLDHKLHIILNKADQFRKIHDFARAYGNNYNNDDDNYYDNNIIIIIIIINYITLNNINFYYFSHKLLILHTTTYNNNNNNFQNR